MRVLFSNFMLLFVISPIQPDTIAHHIIGAKLWIYYNRIPGAYFPKCTTSRLTQILQLCHLTDRANYNQKPCSRIPQTPVADAYHYCSGQYYRTACVAEINIIYPADTRLKIPKNMTNTSVADLHRTGVILLKARLSVGHVAARPMGAKTTQPFNYIHLPIDWPTPAQRLHGLLQGDPTLKKWSYSLIECLFGPGGRGRRPVGNRQTVGTKGCRLIYQPGECSEISTGSLVLAEEGSGSWRDRISHTPRARKNVHILLLPCFPSSQGVDPCFKDFWTRFHVTDA